jgi:hypothetical protein
MTKNIYGRVIDAAADFESRTGTKPRYLYLGFHEYRDLAEFLRGVYGYRLGPTNNTVMDMAVLYVAAKSHLGVGGGA